MATSLFCIDWRRSESEAYVAHDNSLSPFTDTIGRQYLAAYFDERFLLYCTFARVKCDNIYLGETGRQRFRQHRRGGQDNINTHSLYARHFIAEHKFVIPVKKKPVETLYSELKLRE